MPHPPEGSVTQPEKKSRRFEKIKFLYVDDEPDNLEAFRLNYDHEFEILTTVDPEEAMEWVRREEDLGVLLVDQVMPKMTGLELATETKRLRPTVTCVMITGNATKQLAIESIRQRVFHEFLEKPVSFVSKEIRQLFINCLQEHLLEKVKLEYHQGNRFLLSLLLRLCFLPHFFPQLSCFLQT